MVTLPKCVRIVSYAPKMCPPCVSMAAVPTFRQPLSSKVVDRRPASLAAVPTSPTFHPTKPFFYILREKKCFNYFYVSFFKCFYIGWNVGEVGTTKKDAGFRSTTFENKGCRGIGAYLFNLSKVKTRMLVGRQAKREGEHHRGGRCSGLPSASPALRDVLSFLFYMWVAINIATHPLKRSRRLSREFLWYC